MWANVENTATSTLTPIVSLSSVRSDLVPTSSSEKSHGELRENTGVFNGRVHVLLWEEKFFPMGTSRSVTSVVFEGHSGDSRTVEVASGKVDDFRHGDGGEFLSTDGNLADDISSLGGGAWLDVLREEVVGETQDVGELVGEGAEVEILVDGGGVQESQVQNVGTDGRSSVTAGQVARSGGGKVVGTWIVLRSDGDVEIQWLVEGWYLVVVAGATREGHRRREVHG